jgi:hypothetical protein
METLQFEAVKVALKQDKTGYILTLNVHPDEIPVDLMRDFVGARYQVVMVRLNGDEKPMNRDHEYARDPVRVAGILCRDDRFAEWLFEQGLVLDTAEASVIEWLKERLHIKSRTELKDRPAAVKELFAIEQEYKQWTNA